MKNLLKVLLLIIPILIVFLMAWTYDHKGISVYKPSVDTVYIKEDTNPLIKVSSKTYVPPKQVAIFYVPHEDDESLSMCVAIRSSIREGYDVKVVLLTRGEGSGAIQTLNSKPYNLHLTKTEFSDARIQEAKRALLALGVSMDNLDIRDLGDGNTEVNEVEDVIVEYNTKYPSAIHNSMSYKDVHPDHSHSGSALLELYNKGLVKNAKFYINVLQFSSIKGTYDKYDSKLDHTPIHNALNSYKIWDPANKDYAIGYHSVKQTFDTVSANPRSKYHLANE